MAAKFAANLAQLPQRPAVGKIQTFAIKKVNPSRKGLGFTELVVVPSNGSERANTHAAKFNVSLSDLHNREPAFKLMSTQINPRLRNNFKLVQIISGSSALELKYLVPKQWDDNGIWSLHYGSYAFQKGDSHTPQSRAYQSHGLSDPKIAQMPVGPNFKWKSIVEQAKDLVRYALDMDNSDVD